MNADGTEQFIAANTVAISTAMRDAFAVASEI